jgi:uncharacterized protein YcbX
MADASVGALWRYPVKSLRGEQINATEIGFDGVPGDRLVHVRERSGRVVTSRYRPGLLGLAGTLGDDGEALIDGRPWWDEVSLARVRAASAPDVDLVRFTVPDVGQRYDVLPLTVLTDGMVGEIGVDYRRFRPNILLEGVSGRTEREWVGHGLRIGTCLIGVRNARSRCVMTTFDPDTLEQDASVLRRIVKEFDGCIALDCWVIKPGHIAVGDTAELVALPAEVEPPVGNASR